MATRLIPALLIIAPLGSGLAAETKNGIRSIVVADESASAVKSARPKLRDELMNKVEAMSAADHGVFHEDVTAIVAPYFPKGQTFAETESVLKEQNLGALRHFHTKEDGAGSRLYVSHGDLMNATISDVYVVIDFEFGGTSEREMVLNKVSAFLQAPSM